MIKAGYDGMWGNRAGKARIINYLDWPFYLLPFSSLAITSLRGRNGSFAFIDPSENRSRPLRQEKASLRKSPHSPAQKRTLEVER